MTREETVRNLLTELIDMIDNGSQRDLDKADEIGTSIIKLFEQEPILDKIRAEIEDLEGGISSYYNDKPWVFKDEVIDIIDKYRDKEQKEPKRDNFDQQAKWLLNGLKIQINALADEKGNQLDLEDVMKTIEANKERE